MNRVYEEVGGIAVCILSVDVQVHPQVFGGYEHIYVHLHL